MVVSVDQVLTATSTTAGTTLQVSVPDEVPIGACIVLATERGAVTAQTNGVATIAGAGANVWSLNAAHSARASAHDLSLHFLEVTEVIPAASVLTIVWTATATRKAAAGVVLDGLESGSFDETSGGTPGSSSVSTGLHGNSSTSTATTAGAVAEDWSLAVAAHSLAGGATATCAGTEIAEAQTAALSSDRGVVLQLLSLDASGTRSLAATYSASAGWAAGILTIPIAGTPPAPGTTLPAVWLDDDEITATTAAVWLDDEEVPVVSIGVWIDETEVPI